MRRGVTRGLDTPRPIGMGLDTPRPMTVELKGLGGTIGPIVVVGMDTTAVLIGAGRAVMSDSDIVLTEVLRSKSRMPWIELEA